MASGPITSWQIDGETMGTVTDFIFLGSKITADGDCSHETRRRLLLGRKAMTNLDSTFKSRDITLLTKVHPVKAMVFPVVMYGCESRKQLDMTERPNWTDTLSHFLTSNVARNMTDNKNRMEWGKNTNQSFNTGFYTPHNFCYHCFSTTKAVSVLLSTSNGCRIKCILYSTGSLPFSLRWSPAPPSHNSSPAQVTAIYTKDHKKPTNWPHRLSNKSQNLSLTSLLYPATSQCILFSPYLEIPNWV